MCGRKGGVRQACRTPPLAKDFQSNESKVTDEFQKSRAEGPDMPSGNRRSSPLPGQDFSISVVKRLKVSMQAPRAPDRSGVSSARPSRSAMSSACDFCCKNTRARI